MPIHDEDLRQEKLEEMKRDQQIEQKLRIDWDYVFQYYQIDGDTTIDELLSIVSSLQALGWEVTVADLLESI